jgi:hypothetical protein
MQPMEFEYYTEGFEDAWRGGLSASALAPEDKTDGGE